MDDQMLRRRDTMTIGEELALAEPGAPANSARGRLVVVSNRVADPQSAAKAGGLAVALKDALLDGGGLWFGWSGEISDADRALAPDQTTIDGITYATTDLSEREHEAYYLGYANQVLWPVLHQRIDLANLNDGFREGYFAVNDRFARHVRQCMTEQDIIWVHDYHLLPLGHALRRLGCRQRIGLFLHTPLPHPQYLVNLPRHLDLFRRLLAYDVIGFQTEQDRSNFADYAVQKLGAVRLPDGRLQARERLVTLEALPIGIDVEELRSFTRGPAAKKDLEQIRKDLAGRLQIFGAERLDYSKGLPERFRAFHRLIADHAELRGKVQFMQVASPSRSSLPAYRSIKRSLDSLAGSINSECGDENWQPLVYVRRTLSRPNLARRFRASRVGMVTPLRDGMNLVAKEYVAAQDAEDPGVLVLSEFAGAAEQMQAALLVNPYDIGATAASLQRALTMALGERRERHAELMAVVENSAIDIWRRSFLAALRTPRREPSFA